LKPVIIAIVGPSGSGKTYLSKYLRSEFDIPVIVSTTTRPKRDEEIEGEDYFFLSSTRDFDRSAMLTHNRFVKHEYFALKSQVPTEGYCTYVVEENGVRALKNANKDQFSVFTVMLTCSPVVLAERGIDPERIERDLNRTRIEEKYIDLYIGNNGSIDQFQDAARSLLKIVEQWQHLR